MLRGVLQAQNNKAKKLATLHIVNQVILWFCQFLSTMSMHVDASMHIDVASALRVLA